MTPEPVIPQGFADYAASRGWTCRTEWIWPWTDPETGEFFEGFWSLIVFREGMLPSGDLHFRAIDVEPNIGDRGEAMWKALIDLGEELLVA